MYQLWTVSKLGRLSLSLRKKIVFFAPLTENLDFMGIDPVSYVGGPRTRVGRDGLNHNVATNVPCFDFTGEVPLGIRIIANDGLTFSPSNGLSNINTLIWFQDDAPKSTPTDPNPMSSGGFYNGTVPTHVKYLTKASSILTAAEIATIFQAFLDTSQEIIEPVPEPGITVDTGVFVTEIPAGTRNGVNTVFTLSNDPVLGGTASPGDSTRLAAHGITCQRVASAPGNMQYALSGTGNRTVTMGMAPAATGAPFFIVYNRSASQTGILVRETPAGVRNGSNAIFTLSRVPVPQSMWLTIGSPLMQVSSSPGQMEYVLSGQTLTLGMGPTTQYPFVAMYLGVP